MKITKSESGQTLALFAVFLGVLIAVLMLVVDYGIGVTVRTRLQRTADSAALAGAALLPEDPDGAVAAALDYANRNGVPAEQVTVTILPLDPPTQIKVDTEGVGSNLFARALGIGASEVGAMAVAENGVPTAVRTLVPIGLDIQFFELNVDMDVESDQNSCRRDPCRLFVDLALGDPGVDTFRDNLADGYQDYLQFGSSVQQNGNLSKWVQLGVQDRIDSAPDETWDTMAPNSRRLVLVPILTTIQEKGIGYYKIEGFGAFFLESVTQPGGAIVGRFLEYQVNGGIAASKAAWGRLPPPGDGGEGFLGLRVVQLIE